MVLALSRRSMVEEKHLLAGLLALAVMCSCDSNNAESHNLRTIALPNAGYIILCGSRLLLSQ